MLRIVSAASRHAVRAAQPTAARLVAVRAAAKIAQPCACLHWTAAPRAAARQPPDAEVEQEEEGEATPVSFADARQNVLTAFAKESESFDVSEDYAESYVKDQGLEVKINVEAETVVATRTSEGHNIQIAFRAEALETPEEEPQETEGQEQQQEEDKLPEHRFMVDITAPNGKIMRLECFNSEKGELEVGNITFPTSVTADPATAPRLTEEQEAEAARTALRVEELSEEASQALFDYLEALGVDDDLAVYVSSQAQNVRTQAMIQRINKVKEFVQ